jgi:putative membrane protein
MDMYFGPYGYGMFYGLGNFLGSVLWIVILIAAIMFVVRMMGGRHHRHGEWKNWSAPWEGKGALDILKERFAKGEINKEEYEEKKRVLSEEK